jgi:hypothetical protein
MADLSVRPHVVDLLVDRLKDPAPLTKDEEALMAEATPAEQEAAAAIEEAEVAGYWRFVSGQATDEEEVLWRLMPGYPVWEGLPLSAAAVLAVMEYHWPYAEGTRRTVQRYTGNWTSEDRHRFERRFAGWLGNGVHWE